jgi:hypothetical protein
MYNRTDCSDSVRKQFEYALLKEGLVLERELDRDSVNSYLKVYCPFQKLACEAERLSIRIPLKVLCIAHYIVFAVYIIEEIIIAN